MRTAFSHSVRVLACGNCGAPLDASLSGGSVACAYCGTRSEIAGRDDTEERAAAAAARSAPVSESERLAQLRRQDHEPLVPPPSLQHYLERGSTTLRPESLEKAKGEWRRARAQLSSGGAAAAERLFHLTLMIAPLLDGRSERAFLETALETLSDARHRQLLRRRLVHRAVLAGDIDAAEAWLAPCNPRSTELHMDTAYRIAASHVALARGRPQEALVQLGEHAEDLPIAEGNDAEAGVLRAHALEASGLDSLAQQALVETSRPATRYAEVTRLMDEHASLRLCARSWPPAKIRLDASIRIQILQEWPSNQTLVVIYGVVAAICLLAGATYFIPSANTPLGAGIACTLVGAVFAALGAYGIADDRRDARLKQTGQLGFGRVVSVKKRVAETGSAQQRNRTIEVFQDLEVLIEAPDRLVPGKYSVKTTEPPPLGRYPCFFDPAHPEGRFRLKLGPLWK